jgi:AGZA family xanthine/uracil permease-like MFS transporter
MTAAISPSTDNRGSYKWAAAGDINAFFGLMLDNVVNLAVLAGILVFGFGFPSELVYTRMFPGTALGVMFGDIVYTVMAIRLAKRTGRNDVTAMPLGLDSPSTIGMALTVLGPAFLAAKTTNTPEAAAVIAWQVGMAAMVLMGVFKLVLSFGGEFLRRWIPVAGLLGSIGGVAIALLGTLQLAEIYSEPVVGMIALGIIYYALVAGLRLPFRAPVVLASVAVGAILFYILAKAGLSVHPAPAIQASFPIGFPVPTLGFMDGMAIAIRDYLPLALPFALLTVVGGINVTESARLAGDDYPVRDILLTEAVATFVAGVCGGVAQTTPYIGHPAYKAMGGRAAYTLATGLFIGLGGMLGYVAFMANILPKPALAPILVFVALDIARQSYSAIPKRHIMAVVLATFPSIAALVVIFLSQVHGGALLTSAIDPAGALKASGLTNPGFIQTCAVMVMLAHGFFLTAMLWGGGAAYLIDRKIGMAAGVFAACGVLSFFGVIHSVTPAGGIYLPWSVPSTLPYQWTAAYLAFAALLFVLGKTEAFRSSPAVAEA